MDEDWKYINDRLAFRAELLWTEWNLISESKYEKDLVRGKFTTAQRGCRGKKAYLFFEDIKDRSLKELIKATVGCDPYDLVSREVIATQLVMDTEARQYFEAYRYNGRGLSLDKQLEYSANATILALFSKLANQSKRERRVYGKNTEAVWRKLADEAQQLNRKQWPHSLNANWRNLMDKANELNRLLSDATTKEQRGEAYKSLIHKNYGNTAAEKIAEAARHWALAQWCSQIDRVVNYTDLWKRYNAKAKAEGWQQLKTEATLRVYLERKDVRPIWEPARRGELKARERYAYKHHLEPTGMRDSLWYSDGTKVNYYYLHTYTDKEGRTKHERRTTSVYEVMDAYSECLLGYCISDTEDYTAAFAAFRMAFERAGHRPYQVSFDNGSGNIKLLDSGFFDTMSHLAIRTKAYNGSSKTIEDAFGRFQTLYLKHDWFFTGQNVTARKDESKPNMEFINANMANIPSLAELKAVYEKRRNEWNADKHHLTGIAREQMYNESVNPEAPPIAKNDMVELFWILRTDSVAVNQSGITFRDRNVQYDYTPYTPDGLPDQAWLYRNMGKPYFIKWDPTNPETIALYDLNSASALVYVREMRDPRTVQVLHRGKQEQTEGEAQYYKAVEAESKKLRIEYRDQLDELLETHNLLPEQHGLNSPKLAGIESRRKKAGEKTKAKGGAKPVSMAKTLKDESYAEEYELVEIDAEQAEIERQLRRFKNR